MFDQKTYDDKDQLCKQLAIAQLPAILEQYEPGQYDGLVLSENPDRFGIDLLGMHNHGPLHVEVEWKSTTKWNGAFPFNDMHILYRKKKFIGQVPTLFVVINHDLSQMATTTGGILSMLQPKWFCTQNRGWEQVYPVPRIHIKAYPIIGWMNHEPAATRK